MTTIVLVPGALTDASVWHGVIARLQARPPRPRARDAVPLSKPAETADLIRSLV